MAEACETMLTDTDAAQRIGKTLQAKDATLFEKVKQWFRDIAAKLRKAYKGLHPDSEIAQYAKKTIQQVDGLVQLWADMAVDAAENYREGAGNINAAMDGVKENIRFTKNMSWEEQIKGALYGGNNIRRSETLVVGNISEFLSKEGVAKKPLAIPLAVLSKASKGKDISHSIKRGKLARLDSGIKETPIIVVNPDRNAIVYITNITQGGYPVIAAFDMNAVFDGDSVHKATSIHLQIDVQSMLENLPKTATVYVQNENELEAVGATNNLRGLAANIKFISKIVEQDSEKVKKKNSDRSSHRQQDQQAALEKQNGKLREDVERLRELLKLQGKTTGGKLFKPESIKTAANFIMRETGRSLDADGKSEFAGILTKAYTALSDENVTYDDIIRECTNVAQWLDENGETQDALDEYAGGILSEMKGIPIRLPNKNAAITNRDKCLERNGSIFVYWGAEFYISNTPIITIPAKVTAMQA